MNNENGYDILYPGSFVQSKGVTDGTKALLPIPIKEKYRSPFKIGTDKYVASRVTNGSTSDDVWQTIKEMLK